MNRPTSMTIVGWLTIMGAASSLYQGVVAATHPDDMATLAAFGARPLPFAIVSLLDALIGCLCGFGILAGNQWARFGYLIWGPIVIAYTAIAFNSLYPALGNAFEFLMIATFLCRRPANIWFEAGAI